MQSLPVILRRFNKIESHHGMPIICVTRKFLTTSISEETLFTKLKSEIKDCMRRKDRLKLNVVRVSISISKKVSSI
jgi:hypothetical protein